VRAILKNSLTLTLLFVAVFLLVVGALTLFVKKQIEERQAVEQEEVVEVVEVVEEVPEGRATIGTSVKGRPIEVESFGNGERHLLLVGGIHGGYEYNSVVLAEKMITAFETGEISVPANMTVHVIPLLNPDGAALVTQNDDVSQYTEGAIPGGAVDGIGRFNANGVDLNRNFGCKWQPSSTWKGNVISAGTSAFSEPEAQALRDYVQLISPEAVVFWHSKAGNIYASECENGVLPETLEIMNLYATAGGYGAVSVFDAYVVTGDAEGWLATLGIPAITVELETREFSEYERNKPAVESLIDFYSL
jgi:hypothetical protein